ncbi:hypothetical protein P43SY_004593 [Pythium insidiosum]|uniref:Transmembrane protein n=1 Tax=Pythium insidiosum TaxID=114742 RepID=A0AAD5M473_PYTIN|nr:hypothetical protein P43SY_004593 [Pythium insidiosum]
MDIVELDAARFKQLDRHRRQRAPAQTLEPFGSLTFSRVALAIISYGLFLTDVLRTGVGIRRLKLVPQDPDVRVLFGPYNYSIIHLTAANASLPTSSRRYWTYKYDTTSLTMRAVAKALQLSSWSPCLLYETTCDETLGLPGSVVFSMIDELVEGIRARIAQPHAAKHHGASRGQLAWRIEYQFRDRLNEAVLPSLFYRTRRRTCQASFYSSARLQRRALCDPRDVHPFSCLDHIANFRRLCSSTRPCDMTMPQHITRRLSALHRAYPNASLEIVVLDSVEDFLRGGHISHGRHSFDVVTMTRVRQCDSLRCATIAVDEYRYEAGVIAANEQEWFSIVALLRSTGQAYAWLRVTALITAIIAAQQSSAMPLTQKIRATLRTFFIIPSHIVVYGSIVPVICYAAAHALDSTIVYEQVRMDFNAVKGLFQMNFAKFIAVASVSMRTVWLVALVCHMVTWLSTQRSWSPVLGVIGVPELFIAFVSSSTVMAHFRFPSWRDCRVTQIHEIFPSHHLRDLRAQSFDTARGAVNQLVLGPTSDAQFISLALAAIAVISGLGGMVQRGLGGKLHYRLTVVSRTRVPYSINWLWPSDALVINWANSITQPRLEVNERRDPQPVSGNTESVNLSPLRQTIAQRQSSTTFSVLVQSLRRLRSTSPTATHDPLLELDHRTRSVLAFIVTLNLTVLSDPLVYGRLRGALSSPLVGLYECQETGKLWLLPPQSRVDMLDVPLDWRPLRCVAVFSANELSWTDLLNCG